MNSYKRELYKKVNIKYLKLVNPNIPQLNKLIKAKHHFSRNKLRNLILKKNFHHLAIILLRNLKIQ